MQKTITRGKFEREKKLNIVRVCVKCYHHIDTGRSVKCIVEFSLFCCCCWYLCILKSIPPLNTIPFLLRRSLSRRWEWKREKESVCDKLPKQFTNHRCFTVRARNMHTHITHSLTHIRIQTYTSTYCHFGFGLCVHYGLLSAAFFSFSTHTNGKNRENRDISRCVRARVNEWNMILWKDSCVLCLFFSRTHCFPLC